MVYRTIEATNTKTRRLSYLEAIVSILKTGNFNEKQLLSRIARWSKNNNEYLLSYWSQTGQITTEHPSSAGTRYINLAQSFGLIATISGVYRYTRIGLLLSVLKENFGSNDNPFYLSATSRVFFLYLLLSKDADFILLIVSYLVQPKRLSLAEMQKKFREDFIARLNTKISLNQDDRIRRLLLDRRLEVENWKNPERYAEHLIPPRLSWLLDLGLLNVEDFKSHRFTLEPVAQQFFQLMPRYEGIWDITDHWLQTSYWHNLEYITNTPCKPWNTLDENTRSDMATGFLRTVFRNLRTTSIPRVSLTQASLYISIAFTANNVIVDPLSFISWLSEKQILGMNRYEVRLSPRENEAYIVARPS